MKRHRFVPSPGWGVLRLTRAQLQVVLVGERRAYEGAITNPLIRHYLVARRASGPSCSSMSESADARDLEAEFWPQARAPLAFVPRSNLLALSASGPGCLVREARPGSSTANLHSSLPPIRPLLLWILLQKPSD
jgi:hypothetical protein